MEIGGVAHTRVRMMLAAAVQEVGPKAGKLKRETCGEMFTRQRACRSRSRGSSRERLARTVRPTGAIGMEQNKSALLRKGPSLAHASALYSALLWEAEGQPSSSSSSSNSSPPAALVWWSPSWTCPTRSWTCHIHATCAPTWTFSAACIPPCTGRWQGTPVSLCTHTWLPCPALPLFKQSSMRCVRCMVCQVVGQTMLQGILQGMVCKRAAQAMLQGMVCQVAASATLQGMVCRKEEGGGRAQLLPLLHSEWEEQGMQERQTMWCCCSSSRSCSSSKKGQKE
mmetsp:Transcript_8538/g.22850  ORF Transcript_8538/g.22850 Transcript_8538/m.22850 type:complete len:282 (+) Transcript_8538:1377-2222(+)